MAEGKSGSIAGIVKKKLNTGDGDSEVQLATRLRRRYPSGVPVRLFENRRSAQAHREVLHLLDVDHDGKLSSAEKRDARIAIYGHS
jgi:hypothetical protein